MWQGGQPVSDQGLRIPARSFTAIGSKSCVMSLIASEKQNTVRATRTFSLADTGSPFQVDSGSRSCHYHTSPGVHRTPVRRADHLYVYSEPVRRLVSTTVEASGRNERPTEGRWPPGRPAGPRPGRQISIWASTTSAPDLKARLGTWLSTLLLRHWLPAHPGRCGNRPLTCHGLS